MHRRALAGALSAFSAWSAFAVFGVFGGLAPALAQSAPAGKVTVVTSFAKDVTDPFKKAFEKAYPSVTLEVQNRNTNAAVKFLERRAPPTRRI